MGSPPPIRMPQMSVATELNLDQYCADVASRAKQASARLATTSTAVKNKWLRRSALLLREHADQVIEANTRDLAAAPGYGLTDAAIDRLRLDTKRVDEIAAGLEQVADLPDPISEVLKTTDRPNGLRI